MRTGNREIYKRLFIKKPRNRGQGGNKIRSKKKSRKKNVKNKNSKTKKKFGKKRKMVK